MLSYGFKDQIYNIFKYLSNDIQVALFSATMPRELHSLTDHFLRNPIKILVKNDMLTLDGIIQYYINLETICIREFYEKVVRVEKKNSKINQIY